MKTKNVYDTIVEGIHSRAKLAGIKCCFPGQASCPLCPSVPI